MGHRGLRVVVLAALIGTLLVGVAGTAQAAPLMYPEQLIAGWPPFPGTSFAYTSIACAGGNGSFSFEAHGDAGDAPDGPEEPAPYPGTFDATGTVTLVGGQLTSFNVDFTIDSVNGDVTGTQVLFPTPGQRAVCESNDPTTGAVGVLATVAYVANTPDGLDTGCAVINLSDFPTAEPGQPETGAIVISFDDECPIPPTPSGGTFVIGDGSSAVGSSVTYWGSQWAKQNVLSGGPAPSSFEGFSGSTPACGQTWTSTTGNSSKPPASVPEYVTVAVTSEVSRSGSTITGNVTKVVLVRTNAGYAGNPGHAGTGTVVLVLCGS